MTKKIVLYNGAANSGKDASIASLTENMDYYFCPAECKHHLHKLTMAFFNVQHERYAEIYENRELKEKALPEFEIVISVEERFKLEKILKQEVIPNREDKTQLSIRQAMIYVSEVLAKERFGATYFGDVRAAYIKESTFSLFVDGSAAFVDEIPQLIELLGQENILLLRIHRNGCTFLGDSRNYLPDGLLTNTVDIDNNGTLEEYFAKVAQEVKKFIHA